LDKWFKALSLPVWDVASLHASLHQTAATDPELLTLLELVSIDRWLQPFSLPLPAKVLPAGAIEFLFRDPQEIDVAETLTLDKWFQALSLPVRTKAYPQLYEYTVDPYILTQAELPLSLPPGSKPRLLTAAQLAFSTDYTIPAIPAPPLDSWYRDLTAPYLIKEPLPEGAKPHNVYPLYVPEDFVGPGIGAIEWFGALSRPYPTVPRLIEAAQLAFFFDPKCRPDSSRIPWTAEGSVGDSWSAEASLEDSWTVEAEVTSSWQEEEKPC
jgi:hypothetical protein